MNWPHFDLIPLTGPYPLREHNCALGRKSTEYNYKLLSTNAVQRVDLEESIPVGQLRALRTRTSSCHLFEDSNVESNRSSRQNPLTRVRMETFLFRSDTFSAELSTLRNTHLKRYVDRGVLFNILIETLLLAGVDV